MQWFAKTTRRLDRLGTWLNAAGWLSGLSAIYSWLAGKMMMFRDLPWPELVVIGIATALVTMLAVSASLALVTASLAMWRVFRPLPSPNRETIGRLAPSVPAETEGPSPALPPALDPAGLYVGLMQVNARHVEDKAMIEITATCFNASGRALDVQRVEGAIKVTEWKGLEGWLLKDLPRPWPRETKLSTQGASEFMLILEQPIPPEIAAKFADIRGDRRMNFDLEGLNVVVGAHDAPHATARLPLWEGITVCRDGDWLQSRRISTLRAATNELTVAFRIGTTNPAGPPVPQ